MFGLTLDLAPIQEQLLGIVGTVFGLLALFGIVNDPTTAGSSDSRQAWDTPSRNHNAQKAPASPIFPGPGGGTFIFPAALYLNRFPLPGSPPEPP